MTLTNSLSKTALLAIIILLYCSLLNAQKVPPSAFSSYLKNNLKYPNVALANQMANMLYYEAIAYENGTISNFKPIKQLPGGTDNILLVEVFAIRDQYAPRSSAYDKEFNELIMTTAKQYELYDKEPNGSSETVYFIVNFSIKSIQDNWDRTFTKMEIDPAYEGGSTAWEYYLERNLQYPTKAAKRGIEGEVVVQFIVDREGNVSEVRAISDSEEAFKKEAERLIIQSGKWRPGIQNGYYVKAYKRQTIVFKKLK